MKYTIEFDPSIEDDEYQLELCHRAQDLSFALNDLNEYLRQLRKYTPSNFTDEQIELVHKISDEFLEICERRNILSLI